MHSWRVGQLTLALALGALAAWGQDARRIVEEAQRRAHSSSQRYEGLLQVVDAKGKITEKRWRYHRIGSYGASRAVVRFTAPAEVKGVALLVVNHPDRPSDQWLWTPALQRERRIALQDRATRFFGTDFSYEDIEERDIDQYDYPWLNEETLDGEACWRIEARPRKTRSSQYTRLQLWIRKQNYVMARIDSYVHERLVRQLKCGSVENVQGIWTARLLEMSDLRRGGRTVLKLDKLQYNLAMKPEEFTLQALRRES